jgi:pimeloyl-ACP methyl ester carboxylesterase
VRARVNGDVELEYESFGASGDPLVVLVAGFALQMLVWEAAFCEQLAARGFRVVRFDNRDIGLSTRLEALGTPELLAIMRGVGQKYRLDDLADDTAGLITALGAERAHVVGMSMGGMIAQLVAIRHPDKVLSLCSIMSNTGDGENGMPLPHAMQALFSPVPSEREAFIQHGVETWRVLSAAPFDEAAARDFTARSRDRAYYPAGVARQLAALLAAPDRTAALAQVTAPTVVVHGADDPLVTPSGGEATARAIPGATLVMMAQMGHELPPRIWPALLDAIATNAARS